MDDEAQTDRAEPAQAPETGPVSARMQALLSLAVEEQVVEQRAMAGLLADLRAEIAALAEQVRALAGVGDVVSQAVVDSERRVLAHVDDAAVALAEALLGRRGSGHLDPADVGPAGSAGEQPTTGTQPQSEEPASAEPAPVALVAAGPPDQPVVVPGGPDSAAGADGSDSSDALVPPGDVPALEDPVHSGEPVEPARRKAWWRSRG